MRSVSAAVLVGAALTCLGEEGGSGHYFPGSYSSFIDGIPASPTRVLRLNVLDYSGDVDKDVTVPIAGLAAIDVEVDSTAVALTGLWAPDFDLGERWTYAAAVTVPWVDLTVAADVFSPAFAEGEGPSVRRSASDSGLGDVLMFPVMLNYNVSKAMNYGFRLGVYAPTGDYELGRLANTGKNYWSVEPTFNLVYLNPENGREFSAFWGFTFNQENSDTDYESGTQSHLEFTATQHFPLGSGLAGVGLTGYWYKQLTADSGEGATFGDFKGEVYGIGPALSYAEKSLVAELKWTTESGARLRPEGDTIFLKVVYKF